MNKPDRVILDIPLVPKGKRMRADGTLEKMGETDWQSPFHLSFPHGKPQSGIRGSSIFGGHVSGKLKDKKIHEYALKGFYGAEALTAAKATETKKKKRKKHT